MLELLGNFFEIANKSRGHVDFHLFSAFYLRSSSLPPPSSTKHPRTATFITYTAAIVGFQDGYEGLETHHLCLEYLVHFFSHLLIFITGNYF